MLWALGTQKIPVFGEGLEDPIQTATTAIHGLWLLTLIAIAVGTIFAGIKARRNASSISKLYICCAAIFLAIM